MTSEPDKSKQDDELIGALHEAEKARRGRMTIGAAVVAGVVLAVFVLSFTMRDEMFQPKLDVEGGEEDVVALTNDPECRGFIEVATRTGKKYVAVEARIEAGILGDDVEEIRAIKAEIEGLNASLDEAETLSDRAKYRFDESPDEIREWFKYIRNELRVMESVADDRIEELEPADLRAPDAGPDGTVVDNLKPEPKPARKSQKTPQELRDGTVMAVHEAFEKFRVWHTGGLHPCGAADDGETPWTPPTDGATK